MMNTKLATVVSKKERQAKWDRVERIQVLSLFEAKGNVVEYLDLREEYAYGFSTVGCTFLCVHMLYF